MYIILCIKKKHILHVENHLKSLCNKNGSTPLKHVVFHPLMTNMTIISSWASSDCDHHSSALRWLRDVSDLTLQWIHGIPLAIGLKAHIHRFPYPAMENKDLYRRVAKVITDTRILACQMIFSRSNLFYPFTLLR